MSASPLYTFDDGIKIYSQIGLRFYDLLIMGAVTRYVWNCPSSVFVEFYREHVTANHADIGVGTGFCLDRCDFPESNSRLALIDLKLNCLEFAARRLARFHPEQYLWNASASPLVNVPAFESIGLGGILHCLPGDMNEKGRVFDALKSLSKRGTKIFGYTLVNDDVRATLRRRATFRLFHRAQIINCERDHAGALKRELATRFPQHSVRLHGCFAFFTALVP